MNAMQSALEQSYRHMCETKTTVVLYTKFNVPVCASITIRFSFAVKVVGLLIDCIQIRQIDSA